MWVVYANPADYPGRYVARRFAISRDGLRYGQIVANFPTLAEVRDALPPGLVRLDRDPNDDPVIVEVWF